MRAHVVRPSELGQEDIASWHAMQDATPSLGHPFLSPEFAMTVGRVRPESRVAVLTSPDQATVGFFPYEMRRFGVGVPISGWLSACQGVIHRPDAQWEVCDLMRDCGLSAWRFDNLIVDQRPFQAYHATVDPAPVIDLSGGFADYYAKLRARASRLCRETERKIRKLDREVGDVRLVCDSPDRESLRMLMGWKSEQYRRTNHVDRFGATWVVELLESLLATRSDKLSGLLSVLYAGDEPVSAQFGLRAGGLLVGWFTGYDARFARYSPGLIQLRLMTEGLSSIGVDTLQMGKGAKRYTEALKNSDIFVSAGTVTSRTPAGLAHRIHGAANARALRVVREHPALHRTADRLLRGSRVSSLTYGRI